MRAIYGRVGALPAQQCVERKPFGRHAVRERHRRIIAVRALCVQRRLAGEVVLSCGQSVRLTGRDHPAAVQIVNPLVGARWKAAGSAGKGAACLARVCRHDRGVARTVWNNSTQQRVHVSGAPSLERRLWSAS